MSIFKENTTPSLNYNEKPSSVDSNENENQNIDFAIEQLVSGAEPLYDKDMINDYFDYLKFFINPDTPLHPADMGVIFEKYRTTDHFMATLIVADVDCLLELQQRSLPPSLNHLAPIDKRLKTDAQFMRYGFENDHYVELCNYAVSQNINNTNGLIEEVYEGTPFTENLSEESRLQTIKNISQVKVLSTLSELSSHIKSVFPRSISTSFAYQIVNNFSRLTEPNILGTLQALKNTSDYIITQLLEGKHKDISNGMRSHLVVVNEGLLSLQEQLLHAFPELADQLDQLDHDNTPDEVPIPSHEIIPQGKGINPDVIPEPIVEHASPELISELISKGQEIDKFNRYWLENGRKWRENNLGEFMKQVVVSGVRPKHEAPTLIGILSRIDESSQIDIAFAQRELQQAMIDREELSTYLTQLSDNNTEEVKSFLKTTFLLDLSKEVEDIKSQWSKIQKALSNWPSSSITETTERLRKVIFNEPIEETIENTIKNEEITSSLEESTELDSIIEELDEIILPPEMTQKTLIQQLHELGVDKTERINWSKFKDLIALQAEFGGKVYRSKLKSSGQTDSAGEVYYTLVFDVYGREFAVAESPLRGNATYVIDSSKAPGTWLEMLSMNKREVRELGGKRFIHSPLAPYGEKHREKIIEYVLTQCEEN